VALEVCADLSPADWLVANELAGLDWWRLVTVGPDGFERQARLRFSPDPAWEGQSENDLGDLGPDRPTEQDLLAVAAEVLASHTTTPDDCFFARWDGWPARLDGPTFDLPNRAYHLLRGTVGDLIGWIAAGPWTTAHDAYPPAFVWPADRSWCIAADVDPHFAGIGASSAAIDALLADSRIDVVDLPPGVEPPFYR
jgi:hypothetical protein